MRHVLAVIAIGVLAGQAAAEGMAASPRPAPNPLYQTEMAVTLAAEPGAPVLSVLRPRARPDGLTPALALPTEAVAVAVASPGEGLLGRLLRPKARLDGGEPLKAAVRIKPSQTATISKNGSVCGDPRIKGQALSPIKARIEGCGIDDPVQITSIAGVQLQPAATMDCPTAQALNQWVETGVKPAFGRKQVVGLTIAADYICRTRNNKMGAKISEHGRGKAVDVAGFVLADGSVMAVSGRLNKPMRDAHKAACGVFGTTLGPGSDGYHEDNLHYDTAAQRNGPYCR